METESKDPQTLPEEAITILLVTKTMLKVTLTKSSVTETVSMVTLTTSKVIKIEWTDLVTALQEASTEFKVI